MTVLSSTAAKLVHALAAEQASGRTPSMAAAVVRAGELAWSAGCGCIDGSANGIAADADTQYRIGSITKTFIAVLVMRRRDQGQIDLNEPISSYLPETADTPAVGQARIGELLAHTAGIASETPAPWWERSEGSRRPAVTDLYDNSVGKYRPGRHFHYSNTGFGLLGELISRLDGQSWFDAVRCEILTPLGMTRTSTMPVVPYAPGFAVHPWADLLLPEPTPDAGLMAPAGQLWSTVADLAKFAAFLCDGDERILAQATLQQMRIPASPPSASATETQWLSGYGLGMQLAQVGRRELSGHSGSMPGFVAILWTSPSERLAAVAFANATSGPRPGVLAAELIDIVARNEPAAPTPWQACHSPVSDDVLAMLGIWYWGAAPFTLVLRADGNLELTPMRLGRASRFAGNGDGTFRGLDGYYLGETLRRIDADHFDLGSFIFTRMPYPAGDEHVPGGVDAQGWRANTI